jgi:hypothetical protein
LTKEWKKPEPIIDSPRVNYFQRAGAKQTNPNGRNLLERGEPAFPVSPFKAGIYFKEAGV